MGSGVGDVQKKGFLRMLLRMLAQETGCMIADRIGVVVGLGSVVGICISGNLGVIAGQRRGIVERSRAVDRPIETIKAPLKRPIVFRTVGIRVTSHMPFANRIASIIGRFKDLSDRAAGCVQIPLVALERLFVHHVSNTGLVRIKARQETCTRWTAPRGVVELGEPQTVARKPIEIFGSNLSPVAPKIRDSHVVAQDDDEVRRLRFAPRDEAFEPD